MHNAPGGESNMSARRYVQQPFEAICISLNSKNKLFDRFVASKHTYFANNTITTIIPSHCAIYVFETHHPHQNEHNNAPPEFGR